MLLNRHSHDFCKTLLKFVDEGALIWQKSFKKEIIDTIRKGVQC